MGAVGPPLHPVKPTPIPPSCPTRNPKHVRTCINHDSLPSAPSGHMHSISHRAAHTHGGPARNLVPSCRDVPPFVKSSHTMDRESTQAQHGGARKPTSAPTVAPNAASTRVQITTRQNKRRTALHHS